VFLRRYLSLLNAFLYERRSPGEIDDLAEPNEQHPEWRRITPFLAIWDDYAGRVLGFSFDDEQVEKLARALLRIYQNCPDITAKPELLAHDEEASTLGGLRPKEFALIRLMHALQDFSELQADINAQFVGAVRAAFGGRIPDETQLSNEESARRLLSTFGGADRNVQERLRYIFSSARMLSQLHPGGAYGLAEEANGDVHAIFNTLITFPGLKRKKANMLLRDYYELGVWSYRQNLDALNIIPDNRVMRVALRTGIIHPALGKLLNSLLDEFDFQYVLATTATEEGFRRVWERTKDINSGIHIVPYPAKFDELIFKLGDGRSGCCKPNSLACQRGKVPPGFCAWMKDTLGFRMTEPCPFQGVCKDADKSIQAPFAIQNRTWMKIFTGKGGGGGLRGV